MSRFIKTNTMKKTITFKTPREFFNYLLNEGDLWDDNFKYTFRYDGFMKVGDRGSVDIIHRVDLIIGDREFYTTQPLKDFQPIMYWADTATYTRKYGFYDKENGSSFFFDGERFAAYPDNIEPIPEGEVPEWMKEAQRKLINMHTEKDKS